MSEIVTPDRCALVVVDMQNDFCHPAGAVARCGVNTAPVRAAVPVIQSVLDLCHRHDVPCIFLRVEHDEWTDDPAWLARSSSGEMLRIDKQPLTRTGSWGAELYELKPDPRDLVLSKPRHSGFSYTALALALRAKKRDHLLLTGVATNICVRATAVDAVSHGFHPMLIADGTAAMRHADHESAVAEVSAFYGAAVTSSQLHVWDRDGWDCPDFG